MGVTVLRDVPDAHISDYGYPDGTRVQVVQDEIGPVHHMSYPAPAAAIAAGSFDKAPNGSTIKDNTTGAQKFYKKSGTDGLADGTWNYVAVTS
jgi:hypothetical protein